MLAVAAAAIKPARNGVSLAPTALHAPTMRRTPLRLALIAVLGCAGGAVAANPLLPAGEYVLAAQMLMPHLEEMRRIVERSTRCLGEGDLRGFFPVMAQPALRGCEFGFPHASADSQRYVLVCQSARVATGTAELVRTREGLVGNLQIKMGGKNMTFAQRVEAHLLAPVCSNPHESASR